MNLAPIVLFTYNRPTHTQKTLDALALNPEALESDLYIFSDGPKPSSTDLNNINEVIEIVKKENRFKNVFVHVSEKNMGLASSIIKGVTKVVEKYGKIVVLEDDIVVADSFLAFMNFSLNYYENEKKVFHINGHNVESKIQWILDDYYFTRYMNCWGWATWEDRWVKLNTNHLEHLEKLNENNNILRAFNYDNTLNFHEQLVLNIKGKITTWAILWYSTIFFCEGLCLTSKKSYVSNIGLDGSGVHCVKTNTNKKTRINTLIRPFVGGIKIKEQQKSRLHIQLYYQSLQPFGVIKFFLRKLKASIKRK